MILRQHMTVKDSAKFLPLDRFLAEEKAFFGRILFFPNSM